MREGESTVNVDRSLPSAALPQLRRFRGASSPAPRACTDRAGDVPVSGFLRSPISALGSTPESLSHRYAILPLTVISHVIVVAPRKYQPKPRRPSSCGM